MTSKELFLTRTQHLNLQLVKALFEDGVIEKVHRGMELTITDHGAYDGRELIVVMSVTDLNARAEMSEANLQKARAGRALFDNITELLRSDAAGAQRWATELRKVYGRLVDAGAVADKIARRINQP